ncbi:MAG: hypothetical protein HYU37_15135 [Acidobacteria bacterium]|nr:hypothetical protein [Acidobacteriota bacterium]
MTIRLLLISCLALLLWTSPARAQLVAPGEGGVAMGHIHLLARDVEASRRFFTALGGTPVTNGSLQLIQFPGVFIMLRQAEPTGGTVGSVINHFGFNVKDINASVAKWQAAGLKIEPGNDGRADQRWLTTPDGARVEILEDKAIAQPIRKAGNGTTSIAFLTDPWGTYIELTEGLAP